jgi:hypothetical protein
MTTKWTKDEIEITLSDVIDIEKESAALTDKITKHFRSQCSGHGYFYIEQEWYVQRIIKKHLEELNGTRTNSTENSR